MNNGGELATFVQLLRAMYTTSSNEERRQATVRLMQAEGALNGQQAAAVGLGLLATATEGAAVQGYGAVVLRHALAAGRLRPGDVPTADLLEWYCTEPSLGNLLCGGLVELFVECLVRSPDAEAFLASLLRRVCPADAAGLAAKPRHVQLLAALVDTCLDPSFERVPRQQAAPLRRAATRAAEHVLRCVTAALYDFFVAAGGAGSEAFAPGTEGGVTACLRVLSLVAPAASPDVWASVSLADTMGALLRWAPAQRVAVQTAAALISGADGPERQAFVSALLEAVLAALVSAAARGDGCAVLDAGLQLLEAQPRGALAPHADAVLACLLEVMLRVPSVLFASQAAGVLCHLPAETFARADAGALCRAVHGMIGKNRFHPETGTDPAGRALSEQQLAFGGYFDVTYSDMRNQLGRVLGLLAAAQPAAANAACLQLLQGLCDPAGTPADPRTEAGDVTQQSETFVQWEACEFMLDHLSPAFGRSMQYVGECVAALTARQPADAVLTPLFFNMLACFWACAEPAALNVWEGTLDILVTYVEQPRQRSASLDHVAARRRALTLLVTAATKHGEQLPPPLVQALSARLEPLCMRVHSSEQCFVVETLAALASSQPEEAAARYTDYVLTPFRRVLADVLAGMTQASFNELVVGRRQEQRDARDQLRDTLSLIAAVFRRCRRTPSMAAQALELAQDVGALLGFLHGIRPGDLPPGYQRLLEMGRGEREQHLPGHTRRSEAHNHSHVNAARNSLISIRHSTYELLGALGPYLGAGRLGPMLDAVAAGDLQVRDARSLTERCLMPVAAANPAALPSCLAAMRSFFARRRAEVAAGHLAPAAGPGPRRRGGGESHEAEVVEQRQWLAFSRDVLTFVRTNVLDNDRWRAAPAELLTAATAIIVDALWCYGDTQMPIALLGRLMDLGATDAAAPPELEAAAYTELLRFAVLLDRRQVPPRVHEAIVFNATEPYFRRYPRLCPALEAVVGDPARLGDLNAHLLVCRQGDRRRKLKEFLMTAAEPAPPPA